MNRRGFLGLLTGVAATAVLDPERLLWVPGQKMISIPAMIATPDEWRQEAGWQVVYSDITDDGVALEYMAFDGTGTVIPDLSAIFKGVPRALSLRKAGLISSRWSDDSVAR